jgi:hypothetical protein
MLNVSSRSYVLRSFKTSSKDIAATTNTPTSLDGRAIRKLSCPKDQYLMHGSLYDIIWFILFVVESMCDLDVCMKGKEGGKISVYNNDTETFRGKMVSSHFSLELRLLVVRGFVDSALKIISVYRSLLLRLMEVPCVRLNHQSRLLYCRSFDLKLMFPVFRGSSIYHGAVLGATLTSHGINGYPTLLIYNADANTKGI